MKLRTIVDLLEAKVIVGEERLDEDVEKAFASDLMSDVLTLHETPLLLTGLCNPQTIRTCEMANLDFVVVVRNKKVTEEMIELAEDNDMVVMECGYSLYRACGKLYEAGMPPLY